MKDFLVKLAPMVVGVFGGISLLWPFAFPKPPTRVRIVNAVQLQSVFVSWQDNEPPFTVEYEVWHRTNLIQQPELLAVVPFLGLRVTNSFPLELIQVRSRYIYDTNLVSDWATP